MTDTLDDVAADHARRGVLIAGEERSAAAGGWLEVRNPATGELLAEVALARAEDVDLAVRSAAAAFREGQWRTMSRSERSKVLHRFADLLERHLEELFALETLANGRPIRETRAQIARLPEWYRYNAALLLGERTSVIPMPGPYHSYTTRFPVGVVGILSSFNHPLMIASKSLAPALATGNSVVLKPSEHTPLTTLRMADMLAEAGLPPGALNVVVGYGPEAGAAIAQHPEVSRIVFTGGTEPGRAVATAAAARFASATVELGGKTPVLVFDDCPVDVAAKGVAFGGFIGAGQTCIAGTRVLVHRSIERQFVKELVERARQIRIGDPRETSTQLGPVISAAAGERILGEVARAVADGATLATGGEREMVPGCEAGFFIPPTVLTDVGNDDRIARTELFGPVLAVIPFEDEADAVRMANDSPYGLGSTIWTKDVGRAHRVADSLEHGIVWVNDHHRLDPAAPWGGVRDSGTGREGGWESFNEFTHVRSVTIRTAETPVDWYGGKTVDRLN